MFVFLFLFVFLFAFVLFCFALCVLFLCDQLAALPVFFQVFFSLMALLFLLCLLEEDCFVFDVAASRSHGRFTGFLPASNYGALYAF